MNAQHGNAKLSRIQRESILDLRRKGLSFAEIAEEMNVHRGTVQRIEKEELAKQGVLKSIHESEHMRDKVEYGMIYREYASRTSACELHLVDAPTFRFQANRQRHLERLERTVDNLLAELAAGRSAPTRTWSMIAAAQSKMAA